MQIKVFGRKVLDESVSNLVSLMEPWKNNSASNSRQAKILWGGEQALWIENAKDVVRLALKDPKSATFRNVNYHLGQSNSALACGEVNSKNSFGGYGGFQRFITNGFSSGTFLEEQVEDFDNVWNAFCR